MNVFHVHDVDQVLYVTAGEGIIATEAEEITIQFSTGDHADPPRMKLGLSCSSGPRASRSLMHMSERDARGPEEHDRLLLVRDVSCLFCTVRECVIARQHV